MIPFKILGEPKAKQSVRHRVVKPKKGKKPFVHSYTDKKVREAEKTIRSVIQEQLPPGHVPIDGPCSITALFVFPIPKSWSKKKIEELRSGKKFFKYTRPDLNDNLMKMLCDAMNEIVFKDDARLVKVHTEKVYGEVPRIECVISEL